MEAVIDIEKLGIAFGEEKARHHILRGLDLTVADGEFLAVVGPSGVGKSTLLRVLSGLMKPTSGTVRLENVHKAPQPAALVFQDARLLPWRRVLSNVAFGLEHRGFSRAERKKRAAGALAFVGLAHLADRWPHQLSGGQRQRVALARALAVGSDILLMDEPFAALDAITREALQDDLTRVWQETKKTIVFVTHDIDEAVYLADRVIALVGTPGEVRSSITVDVPRPRRRGDPALDHTVQLLRSDLAAGSAEL